MTQIFAEDGMLIPVTVLQAGPCTVTQVKTVKKTTGTQLYRLDLVKEKKKTYKQANERSL